MLRFLCHAKFQAQSELSFVGMLCLDSGGLDDKDLHDALQAWVLHLPKVLWEVGDKSPLTSEVRQAKILLFIYTLTFSQLIMLFLLRSTQRCPWLFNEEVRIFFSSHVRTLLIKTPDFKFSL